MGTRSQLYSLLIGANREINETRIIFEGTLKAFNDEFKKFNDEYIVNEQPTAEKKAMYAYMKSLSPRLTEKSTKILKDIPVVLSWLDVLRGFLKKKAIRYEKDTVKMASVNKQQVFVDHSEPVLQKLEHDTALAIKDATYALELCEGRSRSSQ